MNSVSRVPRSPLSFALAFQSLRPSPSSPTNSSFDNTLIQRAQQTVLLIDGSSRSLHTGSRVFNRTEGFAISRFIVSGISDTAAACIWRSVRNPGTMICTRNVQESVSSPCLSSFRRWIHSETSGVPEANKVSRPMDFVRGVVEESNMGPLFNRIYTETNADVVYIKILRNNAFVTVTDSKGRTKVKASMGSLKLGNAKVSRYSAEAVAEHVGRLCRNLGVRAVVMKVSGFIHFKRKKQAILAWKEGFTNSRGDINPIMYVEDITRKPHNGCRRPKRRRI